MAKFWSRAAVVALGLTVGVALATARADESDEFPTPDKPSAVRVGGVSEEAVTQVPDVQGELLEKLIKQSRGASSMVPAEVLKKYDTELAKGATTAAGLSGHILTFCKANLGKKVGNGQCAVLASEAIKSVGAKPRGKDAPKADDYVWGAPVAAIEGGSKAGLDKVQPGDALQFRDAAFKGVSGKAWWSYSAAHHTAVVMGTARGGSLVSVYECNCNGVLTVQKGYYDFNDMQKGGWVRAYRAAK